LTPAPVLRLDVAVEGFDPDRFAERAAQELALETRKTCRHGNESAKCMLCQCDYRHCRKVIRELLYEELGLTPATGDET
jgi:hypothetical protein